MPLTLYKSSAGSGKTYALVKEYIKLCITSNIDYSYRQILVITFTNKASSEMKQRVLQAIRQLAAENSSQTSVLMKDLSHEMGVPPHEIVFQCQKLIALLLHHYADFSITTIDKFTYKIIKSFSFDLELPWYFEVSLEDDDIIDISLEELFENASQSGWLKNIMTRFLQSNLSQDKDWNISDVLRKFSRKLLSEDAFFFLDQKNIENVDDFQQIEKLIFQKKDQFIFTAKSILSEYLKVNDAYGIDAAWFKKGTLRDYVDKWVRFVKQNEANSFEELDPNKILMECSEEGSFYTKKLPEFQKKIMDRAFEEHKAIFHQLIQLKEDQGPVFVLCQLVQDNLFPVLLLSEIRRSQQKAIHKQNQIHISDFNKKIATILKEEPAAYIYERIGTKYHHFLMDEFQDTSKLQWNNLIPLLSDSIASGRANFIVGDAKQAIYRWRGGEVRQFVELPQNPFYHQWRHINPTTLLKDFEVNFPVKQLDTNYRSCREVVNFNNELFEKMKPFLPSRIQEIFEAQIQKIRPDKQGGYVCLKNIKQDPEQELYAIDDSGASMLLNQLTDIQDIILNSLTQGYYYQDICILSRNNKELRVCADFLMHQGIPVVSSESLLLKNSPQVKLLVSFFAWDLQSSKYRLFRLLKGLKLFGFITEHDVLEIIKSPESLMSILFEKFGFEASYFSSINTYEKLEYLIKIFGFDRPENPFLHSFLDMAYSFFYKKTGTDLDFLAYWEKQKDKKSLNLTEGSNAVQLMTIHKSKGLEFPVVIITDINWDMEPNKTGQYFWVPTKDTLFKDMPFMLLPYKKDLLNTHYRHLYEQEKEQVLLDNVNLLYVALTRASECLYAFSVYREKKELKQWELHHYVMASLCNDPLGGASSDIFEFGVKTVSLSTEKQQQPESSESYLYASNWRTKVAISFSFERDAYIEKTKQGNLIHQLLSKIYTKEDVEKTLENFIQKGILLPDQKSYYKKLLYQILEHAALSIWFDPLLTSYNERNILLANGEVLRPDRWVVADKQIILIDYKTGIRDLAHLSQMSNYLAQFKILYPQYMLKGLLVYIQEHEIDIQEVGLC